MVVGRVIAGPEELTELQKHWWLSLGAHSHGVIVIKAKKKRKPKRAPERKALSSAPELK